MVFFHINLTTLKCYVFCQQEELEVLQSIYGDEWYCIDEKNAEYGILIKDEARAEAISFEVC